MVNVTDAQYLSKATLTEEVHPLGDNYGSIGHHGEDEDENELDYNGDVDSKAFDISLHPVQ